MNSSRLRELIELVLKREQELGIQRLLNEVSNHLQNLAVNPQQPQHQVAFAQTLDALRSSMSNMIGLFRPVQVKALQELGADEYFTKNIADRIDEWVRANPITPAVVQQQLARFLTERNGFLDILNQLKAGLERLNIRAEEPSE